MKNYYYYFDVNLNDQEKERIDWFIFIIFCQMLLILRTFRFLIKSNTHNCQSLSSSTTRKCLHIHWINKIAMYDIKSVKSVVSIWKAGRQVGGRNVLIVVDGANKNAYKFVRMNFWFGSLMFFARNFNWLKLIYELVLRERSILIAIFISVANKQHHHCVQLRIASHHYIPIYNDDSQSPRHQSNQSR